MRGVKGKHERARGKGCGAQVPRGAKVGWRLIAGPQHHDFLSRHRGHQPVAPQQAMRRTARDLTALITPSPWAREATQAGSPAPPPGHPYSGFVFSLFFLRVNPKKFAKILSGKLTPESRRLPGPDARETTARVGCRGGTGRPTHHLDRLLATLTGEGCCGTQKEGAKVTNRRFISQRSKKAKNKRNHLRYAPRIPRSAPRTFWYFAMPPLFKN